MYVWSAYIDSLAISKLWSVHISIWAIRTTIYWQLCFNCDQVGPWELFVKRNLLSDRRVFRPSPILLHISCDYFRFLYMRNLLARSRFHTSELCSTFPLQERIISKVFNKLHHIASSEIYHSHRNHTTFVPLSPGNLKKNLKIKKRVYRKVVFVLRL